jgi:hypothetical protein
MRLCRLAASRIGVETMQIYSCAKLQDEDRVAQVRFWKWFSLALLSGEMRPLVTCWTVEVRCYLSVVVVTACSGWLCLEIRMQDKITV